MTARNRIGEARQSLTATVGAEPAERRALEDGSAAPRVTRVMPAVPSIRERTPPNAVIWTTWTAGYPLMYFTGRRVIADGEFMSGERRVYGNLPLASRDSGLARSFMRFHVAHGMAGVHRLHPPAGSTGAGLRWMKRHLGQPPEAAARALLELVAASGDTVCTSVEARRAFLFPLEPAPVFLLFNHEMMAGKWFRYGTWDAGFPPHGGPRARLLPLGSDAGVVILELRDASTEMDTRLRGNDVCAMSHGHRQRDVSGEIACHSRKGGNPYGRHQTFTASFCGKIRNANGRGCRSHPGANVGR